MESRAPGTVFWPHMTKNIKAARDSCMACNRNAPSQAALPATPAPFASTHFEAIYFDHVGCHYLIAGDRLLGWVEIFRAPSGTAEARALGLIPALRVLSSVLSVFQKKSLAIGDLNSRQKQRPTSFRADVSDTHMTSLLRRGTPTPHTVLHHPQPRPAR